MNHYFKFGLMIITSIAIMFGLMYLNTYELDHIFFSEMRAYMATLMGATMAIVMLAFMPKMYSNKPLNGAIYLGSIIIFVMSLWLVRSQKTIEDISWMKAMIPHHSIAILTSERAKITDPRVKKLADGIIDTQKREISEMRALIKVLEKSGE